MHMTYLRLYKIKKYSNKLFVNLRFFFFFVKLRIMLRLNNQLETEGSYIIVSQTNSTSQLTCFESVAYYKSCTLKSCKQKSLKALLYIMRCQKCDLICTFFKSMTSKTKKTHEKHSLRPKFTLIQITSKKVLPNIKRKCNFFIKGVTLFMMDIKAQNVEC